MHKSIENKRSFGRLISKRLKSIFKKNPDVFFRKVIGVIHVGANTGQEMSLYEKYGLSVIWIEPIDEVFEKLKSNLNKVTNQMALQALVTDVNDKEYDFNVANNNGASSSILEFDLHQDIWPEVTYEKKVKKISKTLPT